MMFEEQTVTLSRLNDFLERRGLKIKYLAQQAGMSEATLYNFRSGSRLLTQQQLKRLRVFMDDYDRRLDGVEGIRHDDL